jgi:DNA (cytosine-5)-methyltransferase 3A
MDKDNNLGINVCALFDGSSCGQVALERAGIKVNNYFASEVDPWAEKITLKNYPYTVCVGDVNFVSAIRLPKIDLILAGSPCQGFSFAGKQLAFDDPRSALFFEFLRVLDECRRYNPNVKFLLENVRMKQEYQDIISDYLGVQPVAINSSLVSAQNRYRLYWCNWDITEPEDKGILLKDVLVEGFGDSVGDQGTTVRRTNIDKSACLLARDYKGFGNQAMTGVRTCELREYKDESDCHHVGTALDIRGNESIKRVYSDTGKSPALTTMQGGHREPKVLIARMVGRRINPDTGKRDDYNTDITPKQRLEPRKDEKSGCLTTVEKDNLVVEKGTYRPLLPIEMERLQTLPDNYTEGVSNTQRKKMLGNGWTVDVIVHILKQGGLDA